MCFAFNFMHDWRAVTKTVHLAPRYQGHSLSVEEDIQDHRLGDSEAIKLIGRSSCDYHLGSDVILESLCCFYMSHNGQI